MLKITVISTKGGVGKTTLTANLGALLADMGWRVLLIDADVQPSLSKYFPLSCAAPGGLSRLVVRAELTPEEISPTIFRNLDVVVSDDPEGQLPHWLMNRIDRGLRIRRALATPWVRETYQCVLIDTQGAIGPLQDAAALAADVLLSPVTPEILSAREFREGTLALLDRLEPGGDMGAAPGPLKAVIYRQDRTIDAWSITTGFRDHIRSMPARVSVLDTIVPHAKAYKEAATLRIPVHRHERRRYGVMPSASVVMHQLVWELFPELQGLRAWDPGYARSVL